MKEVKHLIKMSLKANSATLNPPVGTLLGPSGINIVKFCNDFNELTKDLDGDIEFGVMIYDDLSYDIISKKQLEEYENNQILESLSFLYRGETKPINKSK